MTRMFGRWRGSLNICLYFLTSSFVTARFKYWLLWKTPLANELDSGDNAGVNITVKGNQIVNLNIPFLWPQLWRNVPPNLDTIEFPQLKIQLLGPITGSSVTSSPVIDMLVFRAGGPDLQYDQLMPQYNADLVSSPKEVVLEKFVDKTEKNAKQKKKEKMLSSSIDEPVAQMDIRGEFKKPFSPIIDGGMATEEFGYCHNDRIDTLNEMCKRFTEVDPNGPNVRWSWPYRNDALGHGAFQVLSASFLYFRGSRRIVMWAYDTLQATARYIYGNIYLETPNATNFADPYSAMQMNNITQNPMFSVHIPWYGCTPMWPTDGTAVNNYDITLAPMDFNYDFTAGTTQIVRVFVSGGDDFTFGWLCAPIAVGF